MSQKANTQEFIIWLRLGGDLQSVCVIDSRDYASNEAFEEAGMEAYDLLADRRLEGQIERAQISPTAERSPLPAWADYKSTLGAMDDTPPGAD